MAEQKKEEVIEQSQGAFAPPPPPPPRDKKPNTNEEAGASVPLAEKTAIEPTIYDRLLIEKEDLAEKTTKIQSFIDKNPVYKKMDQVSRSLMVQQFKAMKEYLDTLDRRIGMIAPAIVEEV